jgi:hypothetical protein
MLLVFNHHIAGGKSIFRQTDAMMLEKHHSVFKKNNEIQQLQAHGIQHRTKPMKNQRHATK